MAYEGDLLTFCPVTMFDFSHAFVVVVSGDGLNVYGHMLLNTGGLNGLYFQVVMGDINPLYAVPRYLTAPGYLRYLRETGKHEIKRFPVSIPHPEKAEATLETALSKGRWWWGIWHNCEGLVEDIIVAGGGPRIHKGSVMLPIDSTVQMEFGGSCPIPH